MRGRGRLIKKMGIKMLSDGWCCEDTARTIVNAANKDARYKKKYFKLFWDLIIGKVKLIDTDEPSEEEYFNLASYEMRDYEQPDKTQAKPARQNNANDGHRAKTEI